MDTREKIVPFESLPALLSRGQWSAVTGFFDPLTLAQAERLAAIANHGKRIAAIVNPDTGTLLTSDARAILIAGLREVDVVAIADPEQLAKLCSALPGVRVHDDEEAERTRSAEFIDFIWRRQKSAEVLK